MEGWAEFSAASGEVVLQAPSVDRICVDAVSGNRQQPRSDATGSERAILTQSEVKGNGQVSMQFTVSEREFREAGAVNVELNDFTHHGDEYVLHSPVSVRCRFLSRKHFQRSTYALAGIPEKI